jgi:hypothetical protein
MVEGGALTILPKSSRWLILMVPPAHHSIHMVTLLAIQTEYPTTGLRILGLSKLHVLLRVGNLS